MEIINIDDAKEGMTVLKEVLNEQGNVLLKEGATLTKPLIGRLKSLGISAVCVESAEKNDNPDDSSPQVPTELKELECKFSDVRGNEIMEELMAAVKEYMREKGGGNGIH